MVPSQMPNVRRLKLRMIAVQEPSISSDGVSTNRNGRRNVLQPTTQATQPVVQPSVRALFAAAEAANATGGVIIERMPLYITNMSAAIGVTPSLTKAGASSVAV